MKNRRPGAYCILRDRTMAPRILGTVLLLIALFMLAGFLRVPAIGGAARAIAFLIAVVLPAVGGVYLWWSTSAKR